MEKAADGWRQKEDSCHWQCVSAGGKGTDSQRTRGSNTCPELGKRARGSKTLFARGFVSCNFFDLQRLAPPSMDGWMDEYR